MLGMQSRAEDLNSLMLGAETTEVGKAVPGSDSSREE